MLSPLRYSPAVETSEPDEAQTTQEMIETLRAIAETTFKDSGHALRGVHAKSHGIVSAEMTVPTGLAPDYAQGVFAKAGTYPVTLRFSTSPGDILPDDVSTPRGLGLKIRGVEGDRLPGAAGTDTQDFLMVNGPVFTAKTAKDFLKNLKLLAKTTDRGEGLKIALSAALRGIETALEAVGGGSGTIKSLGGHPRTHILGETFFTQSPNRFGAYIAKLSLAPVSQNLVVLAQQAPDSVEGDDYLRDAVRTFFAAQGGEWELRAQLCTDLDAMPVEDSTVEWPQDRSPYVTVARIVAKPQDAWSAEQVKTIDDSTSFSPWHGIAAHQPLGSINRVRRDVYKSSASLRGHLNGCPMHG